METTAEGVEQSAQLETLRLEGCTQAQGYLFAHPERSKEFTDLRPSAIEVPIAPSSVVHQFGPPENAQEDQKKPEADFPNQSESAG